MYKLENEQVSTVGTITGALIGWNILYLILIGLLYSFISSLIINIISSMFSVYSLTYFITISIITLVCLWIILFCAWSLSISSTFKKRLIKKEDVKTVMRNLIIYTVIFFALNSILNFIDFKEDFEELEATVNLSLTITDTFAQYLYDDDELAQYESEKAETEEMISEAMSNLTISLVILEVGSLIIYISVVLLQKKAILKYSV